MNSYKNKFMIKFNTIGNNEKSLFIQNYYSPFKKMSSNSQINLYNPRYTDCKYYSSTNLNTIPNTNSNTISNTNSKHIIKSSSHQQIFDIDKSVTFDNPIHTDKLHLQSQSLQSLPSCDNIISKNESDKITYMSESMPTYSKGGSSNLLLTSPYSRKIFLKIGTLLATNIHK